MTKLYYVANVRLPTWRAHGIQIMKTCEAFAKSGQKVELVATKLKLGTEENLYKYYNIKTNFKITRLWCPDIAHFGWIGFWVELISFSAMVLWYVIPRGGIFYTRDEFIAFFLKLIGKKVVWETHIGQKNIFARFLILVKIPMVAISTGLKTLYSEMGMSEEKILVARDGVDLEQFNLNLDKTKVREELRLTTDKKLVIYTGSRYFWKGVDVLEKAESLLPLTIMTLIINNKSYLEIPKYLQAADLLILPNSATDRISKCYTSPMKLFEYMASNRPIIASDLPSLREVLDESSAYFFEPDNPESLAKTIEYALAHKQETDKKARNALLKVKEYSWEKRARKILEFINQI